MKWSEKVGVRRWGFHNRKDEREESSTEEEVDNSGERWAVHGIINDYYMCMCTDEILY